MFGFFVNYDNAVVYIFNIALLSSLSVVNCCSSLWCNKHLFQKVAWLLLNYFK